MPERTVRSAMALPGDDSVLEACKLYSPRVTARQSKSTHSPHQRMHPSPVTPQAMPTEPLVSCLMVTQLSRLPMARFAIGDFLVQQWATRQLVLLHDGDDLAHRQWLEAVDASRRQAIAGHANGAIRSSTTLLPEVRVVRAASGQTLGQLRNASVDAALGEFICQWDDDDRYHPERLSLQMMAIRQTRADFCFLRDQLHLYPGTGELAWEDMNREAYPMNFVQGSLLGRRRLMPRYPSERRGEDTAICKAILRADHHVVRLSDVGWCYCYIYHGQNTWDEAHHRAITAHRQFNPAAMRNRHAKLVARLAEYQPPFSAIQAG